MLEIARTLQKAQHEPVAGASDGSRSPLMESAGLFGRLVMATCLLLVGVYFIYAFGAGYFGRFAVPAPFNFAVAPILLVGLVLVLWKLVPRRL